MSRARDFADLAGAADAGGLTGKNLIINGAMTVHQRSGTITATSGGIYTLDRFQALAGGDGGFDVSQSTTAPAGFINSLKVDVTGADSSIAADAYKLLYYNMEGLDTVRLNLGTSNAVKATISFYVRSNVTGNHSFALRNGASDRAYAALYNISSADTWERKSITVPLDTTGTWTTTTALGLTLIFSFATGSNFVVTSNEAWESANKISADNAVNVFSSASNEWYITGLQMEVGEQATPFEHEPYGVTLRKAQRYYEDTGGNQYSFSGSTSGFSGNTYFDSADFKVTKRASPTITIEDLAGNTGKMRVFQGATAYDNQAVFFENPQENSFAPRTGGGQTDAGLGRAIWSADAEL